MFINRGSLRVSTSPGEVPATISRRFGSVRRAQALGGNPAGRIADMLVTPGVGGLPRFGTATSPATWPTLLSLNCSAQVTQPKLLSPSYSAMTVRSLTKRSLTSKHWLSSGCRTTIQPSPTTTLRQSRRGWPIGVKSMLATQSP